MPFWPSWPTGVGTGERTRVPRRPNHGPHAQISLRFFRDLYADYHPPLGAAVPPRRARERPPYACRAVWLYLVGREEHAVGECELRGEAGGQRRDTRAGDPRARGAGGAVKVQGRLCWGRLSIQPRGSRLLTGVALAHVVTATTLGIFVFWVDAALARERLNWPP